MNIQITSVSMRYRDSVVDSVQVHFNGNDAERTISINGYIPLTYDEYRGSEEVAVLEGVVRNIVSQKILVTPTEGA